MKKNSLVIICFLALFLSEKLMAQDKKVALVTFYCDKKVRHQGLQISDKSLMYDPAFNLNPMINKAYNTFITDFSGDFPFKLLDKSVVTENKRYQQYRSHVMKDTSKTANKVLGNQYAVADGFIFAYSTGHILGDSSRDEVNLYKIFENQCDGVMLVDLYYEISPGFQGMFVYIRAYLTITLWDKNGNRIFAIREMAKSTKTTPALDDVPVMTAATIQPLCENATDLLFAELKGKLAKMVKKSSTL